MDYSTSIDRRWWVLVFICAADLFGRRRVFIIGLVIFTIASLVGGLAQFRTMLLVARAF